MGYNIEVSFNLMKHTHVTETQNLIVALALENGCDYFYNDYEFEINLRDKRNHNVITINFENYDIDKIVNFLKKIKLIQGVYIESIYDDNSNNLLFASKYYLTQMIDKHLANNYKINKRERSYSEDDTIILKTIKVKTN
jgi:hypothetical protein